MNDLKDIIGKNLVRLRLDAKLTQLQLAEMLNYSDKAVSKWERGESIPDIRVLVQLADIYHIKVDDIIREPAESVVKPKINLAKKRTLITLLSVGLVWFIATIAFAVVYFFGTVASYAWLSFIAAIFVSSIVTTVLSAIWGPRLWCAISCTLLVWSLVLVLHMFLSVFEVIVEKSYLFYIVAAVFQVLIIFWFVLRKVK